jgi:hypothetical protein
VKLTEDTFFPRQYGGCKRAVRDRDNCWRVFSERPGVLLMMQRTRVMPAICRRPGNTHSSSLQTFDKRMGMEVHP